MAQRRTPGATLRVRADLQLDVSPSGDEGTGLGITIRSESDVVHVRLDRVPDLAARPSPELIRSVAAGLLGQGLRVVVEGPDGRLVSVGAGVRTPWWQRPFVRAPHVRVHDLRAALRTLPRRGRRHRRRRRSPRRRCCSPRPPTVLPLAPTVLRRQRISTTHDPAGGGSPRLYFPAADSAGARLKVFYLRPEVSVGDREDADLRLPGVAARQATIRRDARDEYVIEPDPGRTAHPRARLPDPATDPAPHRSEDRDGPLDDGLLPGRVRRPRAPVRRPSGRRDRPAAVAARRRYRPDIREGRPAAAAAEPRADRRLTCRGQPTVSISGVSTATGSGVRPARSIRHQEMKPITQNTP